MNKLELDTILMRIAEIEGIRFNDTELGRVLGKQRSTVSSWRKRGSIPFADIFEYCLDKSLSLDAVFLGTQSAINTDAVDAIVAATQGKTLTQEKRRQVIKLALAKWPLSQEELTLIIELAI